ncbi:Neuronal PAS domain-containing protein 2-like protein [Leptotrombidium deliense]|uniref:Neuronal PAS domain-containing protein 2-like protein n=1 Tax=Leptotrombidium deliense TaxID=299467 RepID=A0A443SK40_9ACAR|nr:Neuronal PAS domain-containing protein 2-like protein [Leptotrombidium deliense]
MKEKSQPRTEINTYQYVNVSGVVKMYPDKSKPIQKLCVKRYGNNRRKESTLSSLRTLFCGVVQIIKPNPRDLSLLEANDNEYKTRLTLDGRLVDADHRISLITGHFPDEVRGNSAYDYIHEDDLPISLFAHKLSKYKYYKYTLSLQSALMLSNSNGTGIIVHRLRTCSNSYVFLQSAGYLDYDKDTGTASHFVCVSKLLIDHEGMEERNKFVNKFTPHISNSSAKALYESLKVVVGPRCSDLTYERSNTSLTEKCTTENNDTIKTVVTGRVPLYNAHNPTEAMNAIDKIAQRFGVLQPQLPQVISPQTTASSYTSEMPILAIVNTENNDNDNNNTGNKLNQIPYYGALPLLRQFNNNCGGELLINPMSHLTNSISSHPAYSINSMTQFNGVNQPLTGAIFFNFGEPSVPQFTQNVNIPLINIKETIENTAAVKFNNSCETIDDEIDSIATSTPENNYINMEPLESNSPAASPVDSSLLNDCESFYQMDESTFFDALTNDSYDDEKCKKKQRTGLCETDAELLVNDSMPSMFNDSETRDDKYFSALFFDDQNCLNTTFNASMTTAEYLSSTPVTDLISGNQI